MDLVQMKSKKNLHQAKSSENYLIFIELSEQKNYTTDRLDTLRKNTEQKEKNCEKISTLAKTF